MFCLQITTFLLVGIIVISFKVASAIPSLVAKSHCVWQAQHVGGVCPAHNVRYEEKSREIVSSKIWYQNEGKREKRRKKNGESNSLVCTTYSCESFPDFPLSAMYLYVHGRECRSKGHPPPHCCTKYSH